MRRRSRWRISTACPQFVDGPSGAKVAVCASVGHLRVLEQQSKSPLVSLKSLYSQKRMGLKILCRGISPMFTSGGGNDWVRASDHVSAHLRDVSPHLIYVARDGGAVANSYFRKYPNGGVASSGERWKCSTVSMNRFYESLPFQHKRA